MTASRGRDLVRLGTAAVAIILLGTAATTFRIWQQGGQDERRPADAIIGEDQARNTFASMRSVASLLQDRGLHSAVFVSDPTHMLRVLRIAADLGIDGYGSPTQTSPAMADPTSRVAATLHELGALGVYFVTGGDPEAAQLGQ